MEKEARAILAKIENNGFKAYIVGGYPRDKYLKIVSNDIDITTSALPQQIKQIFPSACLNTINYSSVKIQGKESIYELTTMRKEQKYNQKRQPIKIKYISNLKKDLKRRDFYLNTLCINQNGEYIDILKARKDIDRKVIRLIGGAKKLEEDPLRILRAIRFATTLSFKIDKKLSKLIKKKASLVNKLSYNRKKEELEKIFLSKNVQKGLQLIKEYQLDRYLDLYNLDALVITTNPLGIWAQVDITNVYPFNKKEQKIKKIISQYIDTPIDDIFLYRYGLDIASILNEINSHIDIFTKYNNLPIKKRRDLAINVEDIKMLVNDLSLNIVISDLEKQILNKTLKNNTQDIKNYIISKYH